MSARPNKTSKGFPFHKKGTKSEYVTHPMFMPTTASAYESPFYSTAGAYENPYYPTGIPYNEVDCMTRSEMPFMPQPTAEMYPEMGPRYPMTAADYDPRGYPMTGAEFEHRFHPTGAMYPRTDFDFLRIVPGHKDGGFGSIAYSAFNNGAKLNRSGNYNMNGVFDDAVTGACLGTAMGVGGWAAGKLMPGM